MFAMCNKGITHITQVPQEVANFKNCSLDFNQIRIPTLKVSFSLLMQCLTGSQYASAALEMVYEPRLFK